MSLGREARALGAAFTFLTRLPVGSLAAHDPADLPASAAYFPLVGAVIGLIGGAVFGVGLRFWTPVVAILLSTCATVLSTGAFHEDALADALDGFGGGWTRDQVLAIMKDSRVGSYALVGVVLVVGLKIAALASIARESDGLHVAAVIVAAHSLGRWSSLPLIRAYPYVRPSVDGERPSAGRPFVASISSSRIIAATILATIIVAISLGSRAWIAGVVALVVTWLAGRYFARRIGGITGDALGAANQIVELCVYLALAARW